MGSEARNDKMNVYTVQFVYDFDGDAVPEIVVGHGGDPFGEPGMIVFLIVAYIMAISIKTVV